jgi:hypothetical protein
MPTLYSSQDAGFPALTYTTTMALAKFLQMKTVIKACLVTGYGSKAGAGWALIDEADTYLVLRNGSGKYVTLVCAYNYSTSNLTYYAGFRIYLSATYTGMSGNVPQGLGVVTGIAAANAAPHWWGVNHFCSFSASTRLLILADANTAIFMFCGTNSSDPNAYLNANFDSTAGNNTRGISTLYLGDDLQGTFMAAGGSVGASPPSDFRSASLRPDVLTVLTNPQTGANVDTGGITASIAAVRTNTSVVVITDTATLSIDELELGKAHWLAGTQVQKGLRGFAKVSAWSWTYSYAIKRALAGISGSIGVAEMYTPTYLGDGHFYQPLTGDLTDRCALLITSNPGFW